MTNGNPRHVHQTVVRKILRFGRLPVDHAIRGGIAKLDSLTAGKKVREILTIVVNIPRNKYRHSKHQKGIDRRQTFDTPFLAPLRADLFDRFAIDVAISLQTLRRHFNRLRALPCLLTRPLTRIAPLTRNTPFTRITPRSVVSWLFGFRRLLLLRFIEWDILRKALAIPFCRRLFFPVLRVVQHPCSPVSIHQNHVSP